MLAAAGNSTVFQSTNGGLAWAPTTLVYTNESGLAGVACSSTGEKIIVGTGDQRNPIYLSDDFGQTWHAVNTLTNGRWNSVGCSSNGMTLEAAAGDHYSVSSFGLVTIDTAICCSSDGGATWVTNILGYSFGDASAAVSGDGKKIVAIIGIPGSQLLISSNGGMNFSPLPGDPSGSWQEATFSADGSLLLGIQQFGAVFKARYLPSLGILVSDNSLNLTWPSLASSRGLSLVQKADLNSTNWQAVGVASALANGLYSVPVTSSNKQNFYSLSGP
jgi:hypothetical protein